MDVQPFIAWLAPIASTLAVAAGQLALNERFKKADEKRDEAREEADEMRRKEAEWRDEIEAKLDEQNEKLDNLTIGVQTTMRTDIIHLYEKYTTRGWITPEERAAWHDLHSKYSSLNANGLIDSYSARIDMLPDKVID